MKEIQELKQKLNEKESELQALTVKSFGDGNREQGHESHTVDDLTDEVRTKEEEIQILWKVVKEVNRQKGG